MRDLGRRAGPAGKGPMRLQLERVLPRWPWLVPSPGPTVPPTGLEGPTSWLCFNAKSAALLHLGSREEPRRAVCRHHPSGCEKTVTAQKRVPLGPQLRALGTHPGTGGGSERHLRTTTWHMLQALRSPRGRYELGPAPGPGHLVVITCSQQVGGQQSPPEPEAAPRGPGAGLPSEPACGAELTWPRPVPGHPSSGSIS